jgi:hypothetical protein
MIAGTTSSLAMIAGTTSSLAMIAGTTSSLAMIAAAATTVAITTGTANAATTRAEPRPVNNGAWHRYSPVQMPRAALADTVEIVRSLFVASSAATL